MPIARSLATTVRLAESEGDECILVSDDRGDESLDATRGEMPAASASARSSSTASVLCTTASGDEIAIVSASPGVGDRSDSGVNSRDRRDVAACYTRSNKIYLTCTHTRTRARRTQYAHL
jgi:hypothetical protein